VPRLESLSVPAKLAILVVSFGVGVGFAELFGAKNLGTALGVGQLTFVIGLVYVLIVMRDRRS
jgi:hypothetical protein